MSQTGRTGEQRRVVIVGAGFGGAYAAKVLQKKLPKNYSLTVIDRNNFLTFYPLLIEAGVGNLEPRHVVVPIRRFTKDADFIMGEVQDVDLKQQMVSYRVLDGDQVGTVHYDHLILSLGSVTKLPPVPGLKEFGFEIKSLADSIEMRDRAIRMLELANTISDRELRREVLRVVVVGSNFTGIEFAGEYQAFLRESARSYKNVAKDDVQVVLVEMADRILPALDVDLAGFARAHLTERGLDIRTKTTVQKMTATTATLTGGEVLRTRTVVWAAGIAPPPMLDRIVGLPREKRGYIECEATLRVKGFDNVWAIGDCAHVPASGSEAYAATAQNATREGTTVAKNVLRTIGGEAAVPFEYNPVGSLAALGCRNAVAKVFGIKVSGFLAYFLYRVTYLGKMPTFARKVRVLLDWFLDIFFRRDPVQIGVHDPPALGAASLTEKRAAEEDDPGAKVKLMR